MNNKPSSIETLATLSGNKSNVERSKLPFGTVAQQLDGQQMLCVADIMPRDLRPSRQAFEQAGFSFGKITNGIFLEATTPKEWHKSRTSDPTEIDLISEEGARRGLIRFNAAFHETEAYAALLCRYRLRSCDVDMDPESCAITVWDFAEGKACITQGIAPSHDFAALDQLHRAAMLWLDERHPDHRNVLAYW
ncbi:hypothetical protein G6L37_07530 [Agrobacterium rubi]|nr:hypothetical protein [Agrobacterium rubi]NTF25219.1 hypothetical protein [Agrobacterium rubi]